MSDRIIEPSEIIVEEKGTIREESSRGNPWVRCLARFFDYSLFFLFLWAMRRWAHGQLPFGPYESWIPFEYFVWIPIEALLLSTWGTTPGKFLLKTKIKQGRKKRLDFLTALRRSFHVWFRGMGMGIPVINVFCLLFAYQRLKVFHQTSWDRDEHIVVSHSPLGTWRLVVAAAVAIGGFLFYFNHKSQQLTHQAEAPPRKHERFL